MLEPPSFAGAANVIVACALPPVALPIAGAPGTVAGVTMLEGAELGLAPTALIAITVNTYWLPFTRPPTVIDVQGALQAPVKPPGDEVAV